MFRRQASGGVHRVGSGWIRGRILERNVSFMYSVKLTVKTSNHRSDGSATKFFDSIVYTSIVCDLETHANDVFHQ